MARTFNFFSMTVTITQMGLIIGFLGSVGMTLITGIIWLTNLERDVVAVDANMIRQRIEIDSAMEHMLEDQRQLSKDFYDFMRRFNNLETVGSNRHFDIARMREQLNKHQTKLEELSAKISTFEIVRTLQNGK